MIFILLEIWKMTSYQGILDNLDRLNPISTRMEKQLGNNKNQNISDNSYCFQCLLIKARFSQEVGSI